jgi:uncharacterized protein YtpQ (UPF0354 family)
MNELQVKRIKAANKQVIDKHKTEKIDINQLINHIDEYNYKCLGWVKTKLFQRLDELEIAINSTSYSPWTTFEIKWIKDNYKNTTARQLAIDMNRSYATVKKMIYRLRLKK